MNMIRAHFRPAALRIMRITYHCDLARAGGDVIPLGVLAELALDDAYALCLSARSQLSEGETHKVGQLLRGDLRAPFAYLLPIFSAVYDDSDPVSAFARLEDQHQLSLNFLTHACSDVRVPGAVAGSADARVCWARDEVLSQADKEYWRLIEEFSPETPNKQRKDDAREIPAAA